MGAKHPAQNTAHGSISACFRMGPGLQERWFNHQVINSSGRCRICGLGKDLSLSPGGIGFIFFPLFFFSFFWSCLGLGFTVVYIPLKIFLVLREPSLLARAFQVFFGNGRLIQRHELSHGC